MNIDSSKLSKMKLYKYLISEFIVIMPDGSTIPIESKSIVDIVILKNYNNLFPVLRIGTVLKTKDYYRIIDNIPKIKVSLTMQHFAIDTNDKTTKYDNIPKYKTLSGVFKLINNETTPYIKKELEHDPEDTSTENSNFTFNLFMYNHIDRYRKITNTILKNVSVSDLVADVCNTCNIDRWLFQQPDNAQVYNQVLIPPLNLKGALTYFQEEYGIYSEGLTLFQDYDCLYICDNGFTCKVWRPNEIQKVYINIANNATTEKLLSGTYIDNENKAIILNIINGIDMSNSAVYEKELSFNSIISVEQNTKSITKLNINLNGVGDSDNPKIFKSKRYNPYLLNSIKTKKSKSNYIIKIPLNEINYDQLTPNKAYNIVFGDSSFNKRYGGKYSLENILYIFQKTNNVFVLNATAELRKS